MGNRHPRREIRYGRNYRHPLDGCGARRISDRSGAWSYENKLRPDEYGVLYDPTLESGDRAYDIGQRRNRG